MIIKKWDTTLNSGAGGWLAQSAKTNAVDLVVDVTAATPVSIFDVVGSTPKIKTTYLPNSVFDSLYFYSSISANTALNTLTPLAIANAETLNRNAKGYYWIVNGTYTLTASATGSASLIGGKYYKSFWYPAEGPLSPVNPNTASVLEAGDWFILERIAGGDGSTEANAIVAYYASVNNTYELMGGASSGAAGTPGLVPSASAGDQAKFLRADATWATPVDTNTTYSISTLNGDANSTKIRLTDSAAGTDDVTIAVGAVGSTHGLTIAQASDVITIKHADTSSQATVTNSGRTYIQSITLDEYGHITAIASGTETVVNTNTTYSISAVNGVEAGSFNVRLTGSDTTTDDVTFASGDNVTLSRVNDTITVSATAYTAGNGISLSSYQFSVAAGVGLTQEASGLKMTQPFIASASTPGATYQVANNLWFDIA